MMIALSISWRAACVSLMLVGAGAVACTSESPTVGAPTIVVRESWPGSSEVTPVDSPEAFGTNLSGLAAVMEGDTLVLWGVRNDPSRLYRVVADGAQWRADTANGWSEGRPLRFTNGSGSPDAEGVALTAGGAAAGVYVASENDNNLGDVRRNSILRYDVMGGAGDLTATHEWLLNALLPESAPNRGVEAITWIPDADLVAAGFRDQARGERFNPARYPDHGDGIFVVGLEGNGSLYLLALNHVTQEATLLATVRIGMAAVMALEYHAAERTIWALCDESCGGESRLVAVDTVASSLSFGTFVLTRAFLGPVGLPSSNHEGFALAPNATCAEGLRAVFWADDDALGGYALRRGWLPCGRLPSPR